MNVAGNMPPKYENAKRNNYRNETMGAFILLTEIACEIMATV
jgi:hypothetical protein